MLIGSLNHWNDKDLLLVPLYTVWQTMQLSKRKLILNCFLFWHEYDLFETFKLKFSKYVLLCNFKLAVSVAVWLSFTCTYIHNFLALKRITCLKTIFTFLIYWYTIWKMCKYLKLCWLSTSCKIHNWTDKTVIQFKKLEFSFISIT